MENRWGEQPEDSEALAEAAADWLLTHPTQSFEDCARHFQVASGMLVQALIKRREVVAEAAADWLLAYPTQSFEEGARHFKVTPEELDDAFSHNQTIQDRFVAWAPEPPPLCPRCGGESIHIVYGLIDWTAHFSYAGPQLYAYLAEKYAARTKYPGCFAGPEKFCCTRCRHGWPTDFPRRIHDLFA
jgi:hypothetical protein